MKARNVLTAALLAFVVASAAYFVFTESKRNNGPAQPGVDTAVDPAVTTTTDTGNRVIVYYFHATRRCVTCKTIEAYSEETIRSEYAEQLESGAMEWRAVNIETPENRHFIDDFELATRTVVLVRVVDGVNKDWKKLDRVWELVRDKPAFVDYIRSNTNDFLADAHG